MPASYQRRPRVPLAARWLNTVAARVRSSRVVASWLVQNAVQGAVWNSVQLRATLWDGFVGSNVGLFRAGCSGAGGLGWSTEKWGRPVSTIAQLDQP